MHVLVIGGTRFVGYSLVWRLLARGDQVTILNRGLHPDPFGNRVERVHVDRTTRQFRDALASRQFDAAVDFAAYTAEDARGAVAALRGDVDHYVFISSGQVYLVLEEYDPPARETDYVGTVLPRPEDPTTLDQWLYGVGKREAEDVLMASWKADGFPVTMLRLPMVNGEREPTGRLDGYLWRLLDGGPVLLPDGGNGIARHVYSGSVARLIVEILGRDSTLGQAYNLSQEEMPTVREVVGMLAASLGVPPRLLDISGETLKEVGLDPRSISPLSTRWMSCLDPTRAEEELGFQHVPLPIYLDRIVATFLAHPPAQPPAGYATRQRELALAATLTTHGEIT